MARATKAKSTRKASNPFIVKMSEWYDLPSVKFSRHAIAFTLLGLGFMGLIFLGTGTPSWIDLIWSVSAIGIASLLALEMTLIALLGFLLIAVVRALALYLSVSGAILVGALLIAAAIIYAARYHK